MKRFLYTSFIALALVVGAAGAAPAAHADDIECTRNNIGGACAVDGRSGTCVDDERDGLNCRLTGTSDSTSFSDPVAAKAVTGGLPSDPSGSEGFGKIMIWIMSLFAWLVGVAAITLDYAVYYTVVTMGDYVKHLSAVGVTWQIMRDIGNIIFIFGFLAIGICTILDVKWYGGGTKMLPMLLVGAVFLNFSLFITEAVIDTGNLFATQFYTQIKGGQMPTQATLSQTTIENEGISNKIMSQLGLQKIYGEVKNTEKAKKLLEAGNSWIIGFMGVILFLITAFVMFSLAFVLIARFVILLFLIIVAPIGFAGLAIPNLGGLAKQWRDKLVEQTITAPVLLLCLYIALAIITDAQFLTGFCIPGQTATLGGPNTNTSCTANAVGWVSGNFQGFAAFILSFLVAMGLLMAVVIISKKMSAFGADKASSLASKLSGMSIAAAAPGWVGRHTAGLGANYAAKKLRDTAFGRSFVGRGIAGTLEKRVAGASFDVRNTELGKSASKVGLNLGKGQTGGYKADLEARVKSYEVASAGITGGAKEAQEKATAKQAKANMDAAREARNKAQSEYNPVAEENARQKAEVNRLNALDTANRNAGTPDIKVSQDLRNAQGKLVASDAALAAENVKLAKARADLVIRTREEEAARKNIGAAKKQAQLEYGQRLEDVWGKTPIFGTAAAAAAGRVKGSAGKTKNQLAIEAFMVKAQEAAAAGGTTIPTETATPAPAATPPPTGGAPRP